MAKSQVKISSPRTKTKNCQRQLMKLVKSDELMISQMSEDQGGAWEGHRREEKGRKAWQK